MREEDVSQLAYTDENGVTTNVSRGDMGLIRTCCKYTVQRATAGEDVENGWLNVTVDDFNAYRVLSISTMLGNTTITTAGVQGAVAPSRSPVDTFRRGIKRDPSMFPTLKDEKLNDVWHRSLSNQARAQGVEQVLDPNYVPITPDDQALEVLAAVASVDATKSQGH
jgi:hypothetical protein